MTAVYGPDGLSPATRAVAAHWDELARSRRFYNLLAAGLLVAAIAGSLWFANESNAGKFFDRLPYFFDFIGQLAPRDAMEVVRALFDLPSPYADGSFKYNYDENRVYIDRWLLHTRLFLQDAGNAQHCDCFHVDRFPGRLSAVLPGGAQPCRQPLAARPGSPHARNPACLSRDRHRRLSSGDLLARCDTRDHRGHDPYDRRARQDVLRGGRERRHARRGGSSRGRRLLAGARLVRHRPAGDAELS